MDDKVGILEDLAKDFLEWEKKKKSKLRWWSLFEIFCYQKDIDKNKTHDLRNIIKGLKAEPGLSNWKHKKFFLRRRRNG